jgi:hypothetical protein
LLLGAGAVAHTPQVPPELQYLQELQLLHARQGELPVHRAYSKTGVLSTGMKEVVKSNKVAKMSKYDFIIQYLITKNDR